MMTSRSLGRDAKQLSPQTRTTESASSLTILPRILWPFLLSRLWTVLFVYTGNSREDLGPVGRVWPGVENWWLHPWAAYDSQWFLRIAKNGYEPLTTAFFPLYPTLLRIGGSTETGMVLWGVILSNTLFLAALVYLYKLTSLDYGERVAGLTVWVMAFFPVTAFFSAVYTESLFLLCIVAAFYNVRLNRWAWAGGWALLAALTRNSGLVLFAALCAEYFIKSVDTRQPQTAVSRPKTALLFAFLPLLGFIGVQSYFALTFGGLTSSLEAQKTFGRALGWPWIPVARDLYNVITLRAADMTTLMNLVATLMAFYLVYRYWKRQPISYSILLLGINLMNLTYWLHKPPYTAGAIRYMMTTFPFVQLLALACSNLIQHRFRLILTAYIFLFLTALMSFIFGVRAFVA